MTTPPSTPERGAWGRNGTRALPTRPTKCATPGNGVNVAAARRARKSTDLHSLTHPLALIPAGGSTLQDPPRFPWDGFLVLYKSLYRLLWMLVIIRAPSPPSKCFQKRMPPHQTPQQSTNVRPPFSYIKRSTSLEYKHTVKGKMHFFRVHSPPRPSPHTSLSSSLHESNTATDWPREGVKAI